MLEPWQRRALWIAIDPAEAAEQLRALKFNPGLVPLSPDAVFDLTLRATGSRQQARQARADQEFALADRKASK